jgi:hypothetical protein
MDTTTPIIETVVYRVEYLLDEHAGWRKVRTPEPLRTLEEAARWAAGVRSDGSTVRVIRNVTTITATATIIEGV